MIFHIHLLAASCCFCFMILGAAEQITSCSLSSAFYFRISPSIWMFYIVVYIIQCHVLIRRLLIEEADSLISLRIDGFDFRKRTDCRNANFCDKLNGFADLYNTADQLWISCEFWSGLRTPDSGLYLS